MERIEGAAAPVGGGGATSMGIGVAVEAAAAAAAAAAVDAVDEAAVVEPPAAPAVTPAVTGARRSRTVPAAQGTTGDLVPQPSRRRRANRPTQRDGEGWR